MTNNQHTIKITAAETGEIYNLDPRIAEFAILFNTIQSFPDEPAQFTISVDRGLKYLPLVVSFFQAHQYKTNTIRFQTPVSTNDLKAVIDPFSYIILQPYIGKVDDLIGIIQLCSYLGISVLHELINVMLACHFYCDISDQNMKDYARRFGLQEKMQTGSKELELMMEYRSVFEQINEAVIKIYNKQTPTSNLKNREI